MALFVEVFFLSLFRRSTPHKQVQLYRGKQIYFRAHPGKLLLIMIETCFKGEEKDIPDHCFIIDEYDCSELGTAIHVAQEYNKNPEQKHTLYELIDEDGRVLAI